MFKRSEKKIKAVFKMQFQATQVPQLKAKSLMISLVPVDVGKPTVRLPKAPILEGTCTWGNPVYETVKLIKEIKSGRIREKFYYVVVSTGSSKSGFLGEVSIDFADLAESAKPVNLTLPLQTSKSGAILHVTVQNMQRGHDSRYDEDTESPVADTNYPDMDKESDELSEEASPHNRYNGSLEDTESDNNDAESRHMFGKLTNEMKAIERRTELSELEVQALRKQILKETNKGQQLSEQIVCLKEERDAIKAECEQLKSSLTGKNEERVFSHTAKETENSSEKIKQELQREKQLCKKLKLQLQKTEDSNSEFVLAMRDLTKKLEQKNTEISRLSTKMKAFQNGSGSLNEADDAEMWKQKIENLSSEIEAHKEERAEIQTHLERLTLDYDSLEAENKEICSKLEQSETEKMELQQKYTEYMAIEKKLKLQITNLEAENKRQGLQYSESLNIIDELEFQVDSLQKELEKQAQVFEEDLEAITMLKVEQEHRAVRAEEALRKARRSNANAAEEFKKNSEEMSFKIDENEKLAQKAVGEADDLLQKNEVLEELLQNTKEELQEIRRNYEILLREHSELHEGVGGNSKNSKTASKESETAQQWKSEKEDLERQLVSARKEAEILMRENDSIKSQMDQKKTKEDNLHLQVKKLRITNNEARNHLVELEQEKEGLKKGMSKLQDDLRKKEQELEKAARQNSVTSAVKDKNRIQAGNKEQLEEVTMVAEKLSVRKSGLSGGKGDVSSLISEVTLLKERNKSMEEELKEMHGRYSEISLRFAEVEGERQQLVMALRKKN
ncbi:hypothetical protein ACS0TY_004487 [Phlomoides rotata]